MLMRFLRILVLVVGLVPVMGRAQSGADAERELEDLLELQRELLGRAAMAAFPEEVESLRPRLQTLVFDYERFLRTYPKDVNGMIAYSMLLGNPVIDERDRAKALLLKANAMSPDRPLVKNQLGKYLAEDGKPLEALNYFLAAVELAPDEPLYHFQIGQLLGAAREDFLRSGEWTADEVDQALVHALEEAVRLDPGNFAYAYRLAESHYDVEQPDWEAALAAWQALEPRTEDDPLRRGMIRLHEANVLLALERMDDAEVLLADNYAEPLREQQAALVAKLERMRNPLPLNSDDAAEAVTPRERVASGSRRAVKVPQFETGAVQHPGTIKAATVVEMAKDLPAELPAAAMPEPLQAPQLVDSSQPATADTETPLTEPEAEPVSPPESP